MEWFTNLLPALNNLPWWVVALLIFFGMLLTKGFTVLQWWSGSRFEERKYDDAKEEKEHSALVDELRNRIEKLETDFRDALTELKQAKDDHVKCQLEQERMRGEMNVMKERLDRIMAHEQRNVKQVETLKEAVKEIDPTAKV